MAVAAGSAALFFHFDNFWGLFVACFVFVWAAFGLLPVMDGRGGSRRASWWPCSSARRRAVAHARQRAAHAEHARPRAARVARRPRAHRAVGGVASALRRRTSRTASPSRIAPGLDLSGGMRLVYTVEVEEAIRDKRDHFADEMRQELATIFGFHSGDGRVTRDELAKLDDKVHVAEPEAAIIRLKFKDKADKSKIDDRFDKKFLGELARDARARATTRSPSRSARRSSRRSASARSRRRRTRSPPRRRARPARGVRHDARRGHHRRGPRQRREELQRHQGDHPHDGAPRVQDGRRRREREGLRAARAQGRRAARRRGHRHVPGERPRRARRERAPQVGRARTTRACRVSRRSTRTRR